MERSQADLITKLVNVGMHSPKDVQQIHALYDGTPQSLQSIPDMGTFGIHPEGEKTFPSYLLPFAFIPFTRPDTDRCHTCM